MTTARAGAALILFTLALSACASDDDARPADGSAQPAAELTASLPAEPADRKGPGEGGRQEAPLAPLQGMEGDRLAQILGPASFHRTDGPTEWRQYRSEGCVLDVFLYRSASEETATVEHVEARDRALEPVSEQACLESLLKRTATPRRR